MVYEVNTVIHHTAILSLLREKVMGYRNRELMVSVAFHQILYCCQ